MKSQEFVRQKSCVEGNSERFTVGRKVRIQAGKMDGQESLVYLLKRQN